MYILVVSSEPNCRELWTKNLMARGLLAVGIASIANARQLVRNITPALIILCQLPVIHEEEVDEIGSLKSLIDVPRLLFSPREPSAGWLTEHDIEAHLSAYQDISSLVHQALEWLPTT